MFINLLSRLFLYDDPYFFAFIVSTLVLVVVLLLLFLYFIFTGFKRANQERDQEELLEQEAYEEALKVLDDARADSLKIITASQSKALQTLDSISRLSQDTKKDLQTKLNHIYNKQLHTLEELGTELVSSYKSSVEKEKAASLSTLEQVTESIKNELNSEVESFKDLLKKETFETQKEIDTKIRQGYSEVEKELQEYKAEKIKEVNAKVVDVISNVTSRYLGKTLSITDHESLLMSLLEEEMSKSGL